MFHCFVRTWWRRNPSYPRGLEPHAGRKRTLRTVRTEAEARAVCKAYNDTHDPGPLSRKAEYERE